MCTDAPDAEPSSRQRSTMVTVFGLLAVVAVLGWLARDGVVAVDPGGFEVDAEEAGPVSDPAAEPDQEGAAEADEGREVQREAALERDAARVAAEGADSGRHPIADAGLSVVLAYDGRLDVRDLATDEIERIRVPELAGGDPPHRITRRGSSLAMYGGDTLVADAFALDAPRPLGPSSSYLPSAAEDRVWLVRGSMSTTATNTVEEVDLHGAVVTPAVEVPEGTVPTAATHAGLVLGGEGGLVVWSPWHPNADNGRVLTEAAWALVLDTGWADVAWCTDMCAEVIVTRLGDGREHTISAGEQNRWHGTGALSPDATMLAGPAATPDGIVLSVAEVETGEVHHVDFDGREPAMVDWSPDGRWVVAASAEGDLWVHDVLDGHTLLLEGDGGPYLDLAVLWTADVDPETAGAGLGPPGSTFGGVDRPTGPIAADGAVFLTAGGHDSGTVRAVDPAGTEVWRSDIGDTAFLGPLLHRPGADDSRVLVAPQYGSVMALDIADGTEAWRVDLDEGASAGAATFVDHVVYVPVTYPGEGDVTAPQVLAVDADTGAVRWGTTLDEGTDLQWAAPLVTPTVDSPEGGRLVLVADTLAHPGSAPGSHLHAIDVSNGTIRWRASLHSDQQGFHAHQPLVFNETVFAGSAAGVVAVDLSTGDERWHVATDGLPEFFGTGENGWLGVRVGDQIRVFDIDTGEERR